MTKGTRLIASTLWADKHAGHAVNAGGNDRDTKRPPLVNGNSAGPLTGKSFSKFLNPWAAAGD